MADKKKVDIVIDGRNFTVIGSKDERYIRELAEYVDVKIKDLASKNDKLSQTMSATLAALNIADEFHTTKEKLEELEKQTNDPMKKYENVISELEKSKATIKELESECAKYKDNLIQSKLGKDSSVENMKKYEEALEIKEKEILESEKIRKSLQDKIFENQIELIETKKELGELLKKLDSEEKSVIEEEI